MSSLAESMAAAAESPRPSSMPAPGVDSLRVLHLVNGEHYSGAERVQDLLGLRLPQFGCEVGFACLKPGRFPQERRCREATLHELPMRSRFDLWTAWDVAALVTSEQYDLVHTHTPRTAVVGRIASALAGVPMVHHVHSPTSRDTTHAWGNWINSAAERMSLTGVSQLLCVSHSLGEQMLAEGYSADRVTVVPNGVPATDRRRSDVPPHGEWTLGCVALFRPRKGIEILLQALATLRREGRPVRLRAVGPFETPEYELEVKQLAVDLGVVNQVEWTGYVADVGAELTQMDLFVLPSLFGEGLPMVVLEAMAAGVPVVATRVEGAPEAVRDGSEGVLAAPGDAVDLAAAIRRCLDGEVEWSALRSAAIARHAERFSDEAMAAGVAAAYRRVL